MSSGNNLSCDPRAPPNTPYYFVDNRSIIVALGIAAYTAAISAGCAVCLLGFVLYRWHRQGWKRHFRPLSVAFAFWIFMDVIQSLAHALSLRWAVLGRVDQGGEHCIAQGVLQQFGNTGTAISALLVVLLVVGYYCRVKWIEENPATVSCCLLAFLVTFLITLIVPPVSVISNLYGNTGLWCWIVHSDPLNSRLQLGTCYVLMWLAALISLLGYGYVLLGTLNNPDPKIQEGSDSIILPSYTVEEAWGMMWYSLAYVLEVTPISVIRLVQFGTNGPCPGVGPGWLIFAIALYSASGLINTILWLTTGRRFGFSTEQERRKPYGPHAQHP